MTSEAERSLDESSEESEEVFPGEAGEYVLQQKQTAISLLLE
ncbi:hypothetical protein Tco_1443545, partial [Tanacetum coccineum]